MISWVHSYISSKELWVCAFSKDLAEDVITDSGMSPARLRVLYESALNSRPLHKEIVNTLYHDGEEAIFELKKIPLRLTFCVEKNFRYKDISVPKLIVCFSCFVKKRQKTEPKEIERAVTLRDVYFNAKHNGTLEILDCLKK